MSENFVVKIADVNLRIKAVEQDALTLDNIYMLLANFDVLYDKINDEEKKSLISSLIKEIEIFPCDESEIPLKSILFNFPVYSDVDIFCGTTRDKSTHVSTCSETIIPQSRRPSGAWAAPFFLKNFQQSSFSLPVSHAQFYQKLKLYAIKLSNDNNFEGFILNNLCHC